MKGNLRKITDKTIQELLQDEIILPSSYFKLFDKNAKKMSVDINDEHFESEISSVIVEELRDINSYMKKTVENIDTLSDVTQEAQKAIKDKDENKLSTIGFALAEMKNEIQALKGLIYLDPLTKTFNRKWIYNHAINENGGFKTKGLLLLIDVTDCNYLADKYGSLIADNVIIYISKFLTRKFENENINFDIAKYSNNQFVLFINEEALASITSFLINAKIELSNTTLKSKSGLMFKTNFNFGLVKYAANEDFQRSLEKTAVLSNKEKEKEKN
ncbi:GGDEF domain-containing protein [Psychromonas hadalis]|uniref:GGDEF domain-containing protein n=1 Tax=Psychromonas hadalis TaxID=211669 RepID=UPI0003B3F305|nr:GGDEF domain-containing protein [Psychromonas hadalis]